MRGLLAGLALFTQVGWAQVPFSVRHLTTSDGLSQGSCYYILKDSRAFVWISSQNGLNRFDGSRFANYQFSEKDTTTIGKGEVRGIVEAPNGDLWVGTEECLNRYSRRTNTFQRFYATDANGHRLSAIQQPFYVNDSTVWYGSNREGIVAFHYQTGRRTPILPSVRPNFSIKTEWIVHQPDRHTLIYLLPVGFASYNYQTHQLRTFLTGKPSDQAVGVNGQQLFQSVHLFRRPGTHQNNLCFGSSQGLFEFDSSLTHLVRHHPLRPGIGTYRFVSMDEDQAGHWWLGVEGAGVWEYDPETQKIRRTIQPGNIRQRALPTNQVSAVYVDDLGLIWVNGDPFGISIIYPKAYKIETFPDDPLDPTDLNTHPIRGICQDGRERIWIGTIDGGIRRYDPATGVMKAYTAKQGVTNEGNIRHLIHTRDGRVLAANLQGLLRYNETHDRFVTEPNPLCPDVDCRYVRGLAELPDGRFVVATYGGLFLLSATLKPISRTDPSGTYFGSFYYDPATKLLYTGRRDQDMVVYRYEQGRLRPVYVTLTGHNVMQIYPDPARRCLWLCTDRGLVRFDPAQRRTLRIYTVQDGLPDDVVYNLLPDQKGRFWLSTNKGLVKFFPTQEKFNPVISTKGREYNSHAALVDTDGTFYFGGVHGLDRFAPEQVETYRAPVVVRVVNFLVNDQPYRGNTFAGESKQVSLTYDQRTFSVELAALDYFSNGRNQFLYQLSDVDPRWVSLSNGNTVRYADVSPGEYIFRAKAIDGRGQVTPITQLHITIRPPFWQRWWFWLLGLSTVVGTAAFWFVTYNRQKLARQHVLLQNTLDTQENERRRIAQDLHDDVGNTLATIKGILERTQEQMGPTTLLPDIAHAYSLIDKAGDDLRTITHDLMPVEFEKYALPDVVRQLVERANRSPRVDFEFILFGTIKRLSPDRELVTYRIIAELVQNALRHGGTGLAIVQLGYYARQLSIMVETPLTHQPNHALISDQMKPGIGQKNITYRAEYLRASLNTDSNADVYVVMLDIPYDAAESPSHPYPDR